MACNVAIGFERNRVDDLQIVDQSRPPSLVGRAFEDERRFQVNRRDRIPVHDFRLHRAVLGHYLRRSFQVRQQQNGRKHREQTAVHVFDF